MPHTHGRYMQDLGFSDARFFCDAADAILVTTGGTITTPRNNPADYSIHAAVSTTGTAAWNVTNQVLRRLGFFEDTQNAFGSTFGSGVGGFVAGPSGISGAGIPGSAEPQGRPDTFGAMSAIQELKPRTALKIKGFQLNSFDAVYVIGGATMTALTVRADTIQYLNGVAVPAATSVLTSGVNGLVQTASANCNVINVPIAAPAYIITPDTVLWVEFGFQTAGGGTFDLRGIDLSITFNYN